MWVSELEVLVIVTGLHRMGNISEVPRTHIKENCLTNAHHMAIHVLQYRTFKWTAKRVNVSYLILMRWLKHCCKVRLEHTATYRFG